jgi:hypothetical protein
MASLNQIASIIQNGINGGFGVINERIHLEQIKDEVIFTSRRLFDEYQRQGDFTPEELNQFYQRVNCISLECKPLTECCNDIQSETKVLYASIPLVSHLRYVGSIEYYKPFSISHSISMNTIGQGRFTKNKPVA